MYMLTKQEYKNIAKMNNNTAGSHIRMIKTVQSLCGCSLTYAKKIVRHMLGFEKLQVVEQNNEYIFEL